MFSNDSVCLNCFGFDSLRQIDVDRCFLDGEKIKDLRCAFVLHSLGHQCAHRCHAECIGDDRIRRVRRGGVVVVVHFHFDRLVRTRLGLGEKTLDGRRILGFDVVDHELVSIVEFAGFDDRGERWEHR